jgi:hypothetical protein
MKKDNPTGLRLLLGLLIVCTEWFFGIKFGRLVVRVVASIALMALGIWAVIQQDSQHASREWRLYAFLGLAVTSLGLVIFLKTTVGRVWRLHLKPWIHEVTGTSSQPQHARVR